MRDLAQEELKTLVARRESLIAELKVLLVPKDPNDEKNVVLEIRAGTGGDEAALFAAELFRMYSQVRGASGLAHRCDVEQRHRDRRAEGSDRDRRRTRRLQQAEVRERRPPRAARAGDGSERPPAYVDGHRRGSARKPKTSTSRSMTRICAIDTFCSSGPGGQSVNTTYSAVRITHIPTGVVVSQQDEKSQIKNKAKAMKILRSRLYEMELRKQQEAIAKDRRSQVGTGERSEKIRTYHFKENRISDHRANFTLYRLTDVLNGDLSELLDAVISHYQSEKLKEATDEP